MDKIEIKIYKEGCVIKNLGNTEPFDIEEILNLMIKYPLEDEAGDILETVGIRFDVGVFPHIAVFVEVKNDG